MEPNYLTLNPNARKRGTLICSDCGEEIREFSGETENRFICGCDELKEFEIPVQSQAIEDK